MCLDQRCCLSWYSNEQTILQEGDIVNVDATTMLNGYYADASRMFMIGKVSNEAKN
ncbi:MAG: M24 family metallopeptidase [Thomasclavelia ramosa]